MGLLELLMVLLMLMLLRLLLPMAIVTPTDTRLKS